MVQLKKCWLYLADYFWPTFPPKGVNALYSCAVLPLVNKYSAANRQKPLFKVSTEKVFGFQLKCSQSTNTKSKISHIPSGFSWGPAVQSEIKPSDMNPYSRGGRKFKFQDWKATAVEEKPKVRARMSGKRLFSLPKRSSNTSHHASHCCWMCWK